MPDMIANALAQLPLTVENALILLVTLLPVVVIAVLVLRGFGVGALLWAIVRRQAWISVVFTSLIALSIGLGVGLIAQERGLREGTARAADKFELVVAAPGSEITAMLAAVYLQPSAVALVDGEAYRNVAEHPNAELVAPLAFGDSFNKSPVVGTTSEFVAYLAEALAQGRLFQTPTEAIAGARTPLGVGDQFTPQHGRGDAVTGGHGGFEYDIVGKMPLTGSPWDRAYIVPVESVWMVHGLANGHGPQWDGTLGAPFDPAYFPGTPAVLVKANSLGGAYVMQSQFNNNQTMALFPGTVLSRLHALMGDIRQVMSILAMMTQVLVAIAVMAGLMMLTRLLSRRLALLRALGAPPRFNFALTWSYALTLVIAGTGLGLLLGVVMTQVISAMITARTDVLVSATLGWSELHLSGVFISLTALLALIPARLTMTRAVVRDLRG